MLFVYMGDGGGDKGWDGGICVEIDENGGTEAAITGGIDDDIVGVVNGGVLAILNIDGAVIAGIG